MTELNGMSNTELASALTIAAIVLLGNWSVVDEGDNVIAITFGRQESDALMRSLIALLSYESMKDFIDAGPQAYVDRSIAAVKRLSSRASELIENDGRTS